jgi:hypothetical protein
MKNTRMKRKNDDRGDRTSVTQCFDALVAEGLGFWSLSPFGHRRLSLVSGEMFELGPRGLTRLR